MPRSEHRSRSRGLPRCPSMRCPDLTRRARCLWSRNRAAKSHLADETKKPMCKYAALPGGCYRTNPVRRKNAAESFGALQRFPLSPLCAGASGAILSSSAPQWQRRSVLNECIPVVKHVPAAWGRCSRTHTAVSHPRFVGYEKAVFRDPRDSFQPDSTPVSSRSSGRVLLVLVVAPAIKCKTQHQVGMPACLLTPVASCGGLARPLRPPEDK